MFSDYLNLSNPMGPAGEPIMTAIVTIIAKTTPTITNRLFMTELNIAKIKTKCLDTDIIWKKPLK